MALKRSREEKHGVDDSLRVIVTGILKVISGARAQLLSVVSKDLGRARAVSESCITMHTVLALKRAELIRSVQGSDGESSE